MVSCRVKVSGCDEGELTTGWKKQEFTSYLERHQGPVLLYIHGFKGTLLQSLPKGYEVQRRYGPPVVLFSWPAGKRFVYYNVALSNLRRCIDRLTSFLMLLQTR